MAVKGKLKPLSWKPRYYPHPKLEGVRCYCAPACGGNCTQEAHHRATIDADALAHQLGAGWKPVVWENLGWHFKASHPNRFDVYPPDIDTVRNRRGLFWVTTTFESIPQFHAKGRTAQQALNDVIGQIREAAAALNGFLGGI